MTTVLRQLQAEQVEWIASNFPGRHPSYGVRGVVEEFGELIEAELDANRDGILDGAADVLIYMSDYASTLGLDIQEIYDASVRPRYGFFTGNILVSLGRLMHGDLKLERGIRGTREQHIDRIRTALTILISSVRSILLVNHLDVELDQLAWKVWLDVRERDWNTNPVDGKKTEEERTAR